MMSTFSLSFWLCIKYEMHPHVCSLLLPEIDLLFLKTVYKASSNVFTEHNICKTNFLSFVLNVALSQV